MTISSEERDLISRATRHNREAFAELYVRFEPSVRRQLTTLVGNAQEAEDLTSETFLRAWAAIGRFEDRGISLQAWLTTIGFRLAINHMTRTRRTVDVQQVVIESDPEMSPEKQAERKEDFEAVRDALAELPARQRDIIICRFMDELSHEQIAQQVGQPAGTVRVIQHRALKSLRLLFTKNHISGKIAHSGQTRAP